MSEAPAPPPESSATLPPKERKLVLEKLASLPPEERNLESSRMRYQDQLKAIEKSGKCPKCWLLKWNCICDEIRSVTVHHRYFLLFHAREFSRGTNTGVLLSTVCENAEMLVYGNDEHVRRLNELCEKEAANTVCMFPTTDSITVEEFLQKGWNPDKATSSGKDELPNEASLEASNDSAPPRVTSPEVQTQLKERKLNVIVLDATWSQARGMVALLPRTVARVRLTHPPAKSRSKMRTQVSEGRITTIEALAAIFEELCESEEAREGILHNLDVKMLHIFNQSGKDLAKVLPELAPRAKELLGYDLSPSYIENPKRKAAALAARAAAQAATKSPPDVSEPPK